MPETTVAIQDAVVEPQVILPETTITEPKESEAVESARDSLPVEPHTLEPGGDRFKQVWARAKTAEMKADALASELQREREERIRYEERLKAQNSQPVKTEPKYNWTQLEEFITAGTLTRAQASEYRENLLKQEWKAEQDHVLEQRLQQVEKARRIQTDLDRYKTLLPPITQSGTPERDKVTQEYRYMVETLGMPSNLSTELAAARAAFGDLGALERAKLADTTKRENLEATVETMTNGKNPAKTKDPLDTLTPRQKDHYGRMIKLGRYKSGWEDVRKELTWTRGAK